MLTHHRLRVLSFTVFALLLTGCANQGLNSVQVTPSTQSLTVSQTAQFSAVGTYGNAKRPTTQNITGSVTWTSSAPAVATVNAAGTATAVSAGATTITASAAGYNGAVSSSATLAVTSSGAGGGNLLSLTIIPNSITVGNLQGAGQFLAIGTFSSAPTIRDLTNSPTVTWISSFPNDFPVNTNTAGNLGATAGIATAYASGNASITAEATSSDGSIQTAQATFNCPLVLPNLPTTPGSCYPGSQASSLLGLETLTVVNEGLNTTNWLVTADSATGTPDVLDCGPSSTSGSVCVATYPVGTTVKLTAPATGALFGGWSSDCGTTIYPDPSSETGPNTCTVIMSTNRTVGAIFN